MKLPKFKTYDPDKFKTVEEFEAAEKELLKAAGQIERILEDDRENNLLLHFDTEKLRPNPKQKLMLDAFLVPTKKVFTYTGGERSGKCLTYQTLVETPEGETSIGELYDIGKPFNVYSWDGEKKVIARAEAPIMKPGFHKCFRIQMNDGRIIDAADHHKILTTSGWISVASLVSFFDVPHVSFVNNPPVSNWALYHQVHEQGGTHLNQIRSGCQGDCLLDSCQYGTPPLLDRGSAQVFFPSQGDVSPQNVFSCNEGDPENRYKDSPSPNAGHLSSRRGQPRNDYLEAESLFHTFCRALKPFGWRSQVVPQPKHGCAFQSLPNGEFVQWANLLGEHPFWERFRAFCNEIEWLTHSTQVALQSTQEFCAQSLPSDVFFPSEDQFFSAFSTPFDVIGENAIESVTPLSSRQEVYDFTVPKYENYFAGGLVHHNTSILTIIGLSVMFGKFLWDNTDLSYLFKAGTGPPWKVRYVGQDWHEHIEDVVIPALEKWWPKNRKVEKRGNGIIKDTTWKDVKTGSKLEIVSNGQEARIHRGWHGHMILYDEPPKREIRIANARGLVDYNGREVIAATLLEEPWINQEILHKRLEDGRPDPSVFNVTGTSRDNVGYGIEEEGLKEYEKKLTAEERESHIDGIPSYLRGLVFKSFKRERNIVKRRPIPSDWIIDVAIDTHPREPHAVLFKATDNGNRSWLVEEISFHGDGTAIGNQICRCIEYHKANSGWKRMNRFICDPLAKGDSNNPNTMYDKIQTVLWQYGYALETATKDKHTGIRATNDAFFSQNEVPSLFIFDDLVNTIKQIEGWMYHKDTGKPIDKDDHFPENLYRLMLLDTKYEEPEDPDEDYSYVDNRYAGMSSIGGY